MTLTSSSSSFGPDTTTTMRRLAHHYLCIVIFTLILNNDTAAVASASSSSSSSSIFDLPSRALTQTRRIFNLSGIFGSPTGPSFSGGGGSGSTQEGPYDRIMGHPVFQVTTSYGGAYMNMERLTDIEGKETDAGVDDLDVQDILSGETNLGSESNNYRTISLYYMDPDDALAAHAELKQAGQMEDADIRITTVSLSKALKLASNLGSGLVTGQPIDKLTGRLPSTKDGGCLRHKIMPPKKQLFYAARCYGKERVGLFSSNPSDEVASARELAQTAVLGNAAISLRVLNRRQRKLDRRGVGTKPSSLLEAQNAHMDGQLGIPVFYARGMERRIPLWKGLISGNRRETPLFFNYEDLLDAWQKTRVVSSKFGNRKASSSKHLPMEPSVEVFNLFDVLTSMEKDQDRKRIQQSSLPITKRVVQTLAGPFQRRFTSLKEPADLDTITFVPSSDAGRYKESITARGNGKARLRPMR